MTLFAALLERRASFAISLAVVALDQITKLLAHALLPQREPVEVIPHFFNLIYSRNPGGLFGYFGQLAAPWRAVLLTLFPVLAVGLIVMFLLRGDTANRPTRIGLALILGGAVGNLIDRLFRGEVVDFLDVYVGAPSVSRWLVAHFGTAHWPTFNVADSTIVVGAGFLLASTLWPQAAADGTR